MSEFPALRDALVAAGMRRRRRRRTVGAALPLLAAAAAVIALLSLPHSTPDREQAAPQRLTPLQELFGVFRRAQRPEDRMPAGPAGRYGIDPAGARQIGGAGSGFYAAPTRGGRSLCTVVVSGAGYGGGCARIRDLRPGVAHGQWSGATYALLFPDGVRDVRLLHADGRHDAPRIVDNGVFARSDDEFTGVSWTSGTTRYVSRIGRPPKSRLLPSATCQAALDPLPPDAAERAARTALIAVDRLYPEAKSARVVGSSEAPHDLGGCPAAVLRRSVEVVLAVGKKPRRLLVGFQDGAPRVFHALD